jgi:uncharacterized protein (DUF4415 family)
MNLENTGITENERSLRLRKAKGKEKPLQQPVTMRLDKDSVDYFKSLAEESGIPYQTLINLYLRDCAANEKKLDLKWR